MTARHRAPSRPAALRLLRAAAAAAAAKKAHDPVAFDLRTLAGVADYFLICSGASEVQVKAIAEAVEERLHEHGASPWHVEGLAGRGRKSWAATSTTRTAPRGGRAGGFSHWPLDQPLEARGRGRARFRRSLTR